MRQMTSKRIGSHRLSTLRRQKGVSLIPALITICIFTVLATKVIIPNQNRNMRESNINAVASSAEQLIQASYAHRAASASPPSWPTSIGDNTTAGDLVPTYLPVFNNHTPWGGEWAIGFNATGNMYFETDTKNQNTAQALVQKIGSNAQIVGTVVRIYPAKGASPSLEIENLTIKNKLIVKGEIRLEGTERNFVLKTTFPGPIIPGAPLPATTFQVLKATAFQPASSKRFKQNIHPLETPIENIYQLKPVTYDYKKAFKQYKTPNAANKEIGLIAEQVMPLIPEITLVEDNKVVGIDYPKLSILLLKAVQELRTEVTSLQRSNQQLQQQINNLTLPSPLHESNMIKTTQ